MKALFLLLCSLSTAQTQLSSSQVRSHAEPNTKVAWDQAWRLCMSKQIGASVAQRTSVLSEGKVQTFYAYVEDKTQKACVAQTNQIAVKRVAYGSAGWTGNTYALPELVDPRAMFAVVIYSSGNPTPQILVSGQDWTTVPGSVTLKTVLKPGDYVTLEWVVAP